VTIWTATTEAGQWIGLDLPHDESHAIPWEYCCHHGNYSGNGNRSRDNTAVTVAVLQSVNCQPMRADAVDAVISHTAVSSGAFLIQAVWTWCNSVSYFRSTDDGNRLIGCMGRWS